MPKLDPNIPPSSFYKYFRDCYKVDYKEYIIDNILATKYKFKWFVKDKETLVHDNLPIIPFDHPKIEDLEKEIELYRLEKQLLYGCYFVLGKSNNAFVKDKRICAPLLLFPVKIKVIDEFHFLEIDRESPIINQGILDKFIPLNEERDKDHFVAKLNEGLYNAQGDFTNIRWLLEETFKNVDSRELIMTPSVWSAAEIRKYYTTNNLKDQEFKVIPAAGTVFVEKTQSSLRVLNDLEKMITKDRWSSSLSELMLNNTRTSKFDFSYLKSRLNTQQYKCVKNASKYSNSVIIGPPGTGKTYTIASLVVDFLIRGKSILVVSKTKQSVEVIRDMLAKDFWVKDHLIHTTSSRYKISLLNKLERYLSGIISKQDTYYRDNVERWYEYLNREEIRFENLVEKELRRSELTFSKDLSFKDKWKKFLMHHFYVPKKELWESFESIENYADTLEREVKLYAKRKILNNIHHNLGVYRKDLALFHESLLASNFTSYKEILAKVNYENVLKVFPVWLANLADLNAVLPLQKDLFDLVIIDEATQCDIATALPALYRAKKVVVAGDPNQLRHYSFISQNQQQTFRKEYNLPQDAIFDYRNRSILDVFLSKINAQDQITFLREHFRSTPSLIEFSNVNFYDKQLEVLKSTPKHTADHQIELIETNGERDRKGVNLQEADDLLKKLKEVVSFYALKKKENPSIGVITLFSAQATYINKLIKDTFDIKTIKKFNLLCGTPYAFQGSEREIIFLSFVVCDKTHHSALRHASQPEVLNVAVTRAKSFQYIFKSISDKNLNNDSLLSSYFRFIKDFSHYKEDEAYRDKFQTEVEKTLSEIGCEEIYLGYPVAGNVLDILVCYKDQNFFIDLIGYPGSFKEAYSIERYKTLRRTGIKSFPLHYSFWKFNPTEAKKALKDFIEQS